MTDYVTKWYKSQKNKYKENSNYRNARGFTSAGSVMVVLGILCGIFSYVDFVIKHTQYIWIVFLIATIVLLAFGIGFIWIVNDDLRIEQHQDEFLKKNFKMCAPHKSGKMKTNGSLDSDGTIASYIALNTMLKQDPNLVVDNIEATDNYDYGEPVFTINAHSGDGTKQYAPKLKIMPKQKVSRNAVKISAHIDIEGAKKIKKVDAAPDNNKTKEDER